MKLDKLDEKIKTLRGLPIELNKEELTFRIACVESVLNQYPDETKLSGIEKLKRYDLAEKIQNATIDTEFKVDELSEIKTAVARNFGPVVYGPVCKMIESAKTN